MTGSGVGAQCEDRTHLKTFEYMYYGSVLHFRIRESEKGPDRQVYFPARRSRRLRMPLAGSNKMTYGCGSWIAWG
jgi:hypothetical protein